MAIVASDKSRLPKKIGGNYQVKNLVLTQDEL